MEAGLLNLSTNVQTVNLNLVLGSTAAGQFNATGNLVVTGIVSDGGAGLGITKSGTGMFDPVRREYLQRQHARRRRDTLAGQRLGAAKQHRHDEHQRRGELCPGHHRPGFWRLGGAGNIVLATAASEPVMLNVGQNGQSTTYGGVLTGAGGLIKQGAGILTLTAAQNYNGPTVIDGGVLKLQQPSAYQPVEIGVNFDRGRGVRRPSPKRRWRRQLATQTRLRDVRGD